MTPVLILGVSIEVFAVASPLLTLLVMAAYRFGVKEIKAAIDSIATNIKTEFQGLTKKVDEVVVSQVEIKTELKRVDNTLQTHGNDIAHLKGVNEGVAQEQARVTNGSNKSPEVQVLDAAKETVEAAVKTVDAAIVKEEGK